jgi:hypothetical protein
MPIQKLLDLSTGHLSRKDIELLKDYKAEDNSSDKALIAYPFAYGWTVSTSGMLNSEDRFERIDEMRQEGFSEYFVAVMVHAAELGAVIVRFDRDAEYEPGLARFEDGADEPVAEASPAP